MAIVQASHYARELGLKGEVDEIRAEMAELRGRYTAYARRAKVLLSKLDPLGTLPVPNEALFSEKVDGYGPSEGICSEEMLEPLMADKISVPALSMRREVLTPTRAVSTPRATPLVTPRSCCGSPRKMATSPGAPSTPRDTHALCSPRHDKLVVSSGSARYPHAADRDRKSFALSLPLCQRPHKAVLHNAAERGDISLSQSLDLSHVQACGDQPSNPFSPRPRPLEAILEGDLAVAIHATALAHVPSSPSLRGASDKASARVYAAREVSRIS